MHRIGDRGPVYYRFEQWHNNHAPVHGVFSRLGGVSSAPWTSLNVGSTVGDEPSAVARNNQLVVEAMGYSAGQTCTVWQVHGTETIVADEQDLQAYPKGLLGKADGLVTGREDVLLVMRFADCVPVLFFDPVQRVVGMAHAGWRGTVAGAGPSVVNTMVDVYGSSPDDIEACIGPSIGPECYQVGDEVVEAVAQSFGTLDGLITTGLAGDAYFNLWEANRRALAVVGVSKIEVAGMCTACRTDEFYSHRAEAGSTGRFGAAIALPKRM